MSASLLIIVGLVVVAGATVVAMPGKSFREAMLISWRQVLRVHPIVAPAAFIVWYSISARHCFASWQWKAS